MLKVLVVDDSATCREYLHYILTMDDSFSHIYLASNGQEAITLLQKNSAIDVIIMDVNMPDMDGYVSTQKILETRSIPIVLTSTSWREGETVTSLQAMQAGAVTAIPKPTGLYRDINDHTRAQFLRTVKAMSEVKVVRRKPHLSSIEKSVHSFKNVPYSGMKRPISQAKVVVIGVSTGGPPLLRELFTALPRDYSLPIVVVQHISVGFLPGLCRWLKEESGPQITIAENEMTLEAGTIYFAPEGHQIEITNGIIKLYRDHQRTMNKLSPSVAYLFASAAKNYGKNAIGILLTGMGRDGAAELKQMRDQGAITIAQEESSCVVYGMPQEAVRLGGVEMQLTPAEIIQRLLLWGEDSQLHTPSNS